MENTELQNLLPSESDTEKEEMCDINETTQLIDKEEQEMEDNIVEEESKINDIIWLPDRQQSPELKIEYPEFEYTLPETQMIPLKLMKIEMPVPEREPMYTGDPDNCDQEMEDYATGIESEMDKGAFAPHLYDASVEWGESPQKQIRAKVHEVCRPSELNDIERYYFNVVKNENSGLPQDMEVFCSEVVIDCAQRQMENEKQYYLEETEVICVYTFMQKVASLAEELAHSWPMHSSLEMSHPAELDSEEEIHTSSRHFEARIMKMEELARYGDNPDYDPSKKVKKPDQVDSKMERKPLDIAVAIFRDDDASLELSIGEEQVPQTLCRRLLEAVEFNSLKCLDVICRHFENVLESLSPTHYFRLLTKATHHRRFHLNWPPEFASKDSPLHLIATRCSAVKAMEVFEKYQSVLEIFIDLPNDNYSTPLLLAIKKGNVAIAEKLLQNNIKKLDLTMNEFLESPLSLTALNGNAHLMKIILNSTPGINEMLTGWCDDIVYEKGHTILYPASQSKNKRILEVLMSVENFSQLLEYERTRDDWFDFVSNVCESGCEEMLKKIFAMDGDAGENEKSFYNLQDDKGVTPFMRAAAAGQTNIVEQIIKIKNGIDLVSQLDKSQKNVFHYAIKNPETLSYLLDLHKYGDLKIEIVNQKNVDGCTPLQNAAKQKYTESFKLLLDYKSSEDDLFSRPYVGYKDIEILKTAIEDWERRATASAEEFVRGDGIYQPLIQAAKHGNIEMMEYLIEKGTNVEQRGFDDSTALHYAAAANQLLAVQYLVDNYPPLLDMTNDCGQTAAACATEAGNVEILKYLLRKNTLLTSNNTDRVNILDCAYGYTETAEKTVMEVIKFCKQHKNPLKLQELLENSTFGPDLLMAKFIQTIPNVAMEIFNQCREEKSELRNRSYAQMTEEKEVVYHFFPFKKKTFYQDRGQIRSIQAMLDYERDGCLAHPVVLKFMDRILNSTQAIVWFSCDFFLYLMFLILLTTYSTLFTSGSRTQSSLSILSLLIIIVTVLNLLKEALQIIVLRHKYLYHFDNAIEWLMYICAVLFVVDESQMNRSLQTGAGAIALFFAWINFIIYIKWLPQLGIYIIMVEKVFKTVLKVLPIVLLFIMAFSLSFTMLMPQDGGFAKFGTSFLTTFVMMTGEIDFRDTFLEYQSSTFHHIQRLFLVMFLIVVCVVVMNLLTGLAVDDTNEIMERSKEERRIEKAIMVLSIHRTLTTIGDLFGTKRSNALYEKLVESNFMEKSLWWRIMNSFIGEKDAKIVIEQQEENNALEKFEEKLDNMNKINEQKGNENILQLKGVKGDLIDRMTELEIKQLEFTERHTELLLEQGSNLDSKFMATIDDLSARNDEAFSNMSTAVANLQTKTEDDIKQLEKKVKRLNKMLEIVELNIEAVNSAVHKNV